jgi:hypothetical protein
MSTPEKCTTPVQSNPGGKKRASTTLSGVQQSFRIRRPSSIAVSSQITAPAQVIQILDPKQVTPLASGTYIFDMGQNMVGGVTLKVKGQAGIKVRLRFAEILNPDGSLYTANLRNADATDTYILRGGGAETFTPHFTFHGFRYVEVTGYPGTPILGAIKGEVVSSVSGEPVAKLSTSSELGEQSFHSAFSSPIAVV